ncbi:metallophosphoesterase [Clostridium oceanicum]|uniref:Phosphoesterase n=1 Tax=Clostridium oceanicum TaxID=1543 RepID=A0ABP3UH73_9CLOT
MKIGVISDTHRGISDINKLVNKFKDTDMLIHLGDNVEDVDIISKVYKKEIINVKGNCDFGVEHPSELLKVIGGKKFFITHGHLYNVKYNLTTLMYRAMELEADVVLFGHTHIPCIENISNIWFINPGSAIMPRNGVPSICIIDLENNHINPCIEKI